MKRKIEILLRVYTVVFGLLMLLLLRYNRPRPLAEWDDYTLPIASMLNDHDFCISSDDVEVYKEIFPEWKDYISDYSLSFYTNRAGNEELTYYYPVYAIACLPFVIGLRIIGHSTLLAFSFTNLLLLMVALFYVARNLKTSPWIRLLLVLILSVNPAVFYIRWPSAEIMIYALLMMGATCWYNGWNKRAAVFVSIAGMLNPTVLCIGIIMIAQYFVSLFRSHTDKTQWSTYIVQKIPEVLRYGLCYIPGIIPMIYNLYHTGHMNLTASHAVFTQSNESTIERFFAYLFDLNFGLLPYYAVLLPLAILLIGLAIVRKHWKYLLWIITFLVNVYLYSIMTHINSGMSGVARYNVWGCTLLIFAVVLYGYEMLHKQMAKMIGGCLVCLSVLLSGVIICRYYPEYLETNLNNRKMTPIAAWTLEHAPAVYNPMFSTFYARTLHEEGGYDYLEHTPIVYAGEDGYIHKILASKKDAEVLTHGFVSCSGNDAWFERKVEALGEEPEYISVPKNVQLVRGVSYTLGTPITCQGEDYNARDYVLRGLSHMEEWGSWTDGRELWMSFVSDSDCRIISATITCPNVFMEQQPVIVYVNDVEVTNQDVAAGDSFSFSFENPGKGEIVRIRMEFPGAHSVARYGGAEDRVLGIGISQMVFEEAE